MTSTERHKRWREKNKEHYRIYQREYKRKMRAKMQYEKLESEPK